MCCRRDRRSTIKVDIRRPLVYNEVVSETMIDSPEVWTLNGKPHYLRVRDFAAEQAAYVRLNPAAADEDDGYDEGWYPDFAGDRPPVAYELVAVNGIAGPGGAVTEAKHYYTVTGAYYSAYDEVAHMLYSDGWEGPPPTAEELAECEHGLSARLCAGPGHYPMDDR